jgi:hypothetical protein
VSVETNQLSFCVLFYFILFYLCLLSGDLLIFLLSISLFLFLCLQETSLLVIGKSYPLFIPIFMIYFCSFLFYEAYLTLLFFTF